jgi:hypothetical protein
VVDAFGRPAGWGLRFPIVVVVSGSRSLAISLVNSAFYCSEDVGERGMSEEICCEKKMQDDVTF